MEGQCNIIDDLWILFCMGELARVGWFCAHLQCCLFLDNHSSKRIDQLHIL